MIEIAKDELLKIISSSYPMTSVIKTGALKNLGLYLEGEWKLINDDYGYLCLVNTTGFGKRIIPRFPFVVRINGKLSKEFRGFCRRNSGGLVNSIYIRDGFKVIITTYNDRKVLLLGRKEYYDFES